MPGFRRLWQFLGHTRRDERGHVAMIFAAAIIPLVSMVGAVVDYGQASNTRSKMQAALDAAVLAAAKQYAATGSMAAAQSTAETHYSKAAFNAPSGTITQAVMGAGVLEISAAATIDTTFLGLVGIPKMDVTASSAAAISGKELELSVVLDSTGSMYGRPLAELKAASADLLDIVLTKSQKRRRMAIVPFAHAVNVGNYFEAVTGETREHTVNVCNKWYWKKKCWDEVRAYSSCVVERKGPENDTDVPPADGQYFRVYDVEKAVANDRKIRGYPCRPGSAMMAPLTSDRAVLEDAINDMVADGSTAGHIGAAWAWYTLSPNWAGIWPIESQPGDYRDDGIMKVTIIMTDGEFNTWYAASHGNSNTQARRLCDNMKEDGIIVYTVGLNLNSKSATNILKDCATSSEHFFFPYDGQALRDVFRDIGQRIADGADGITLTR